MANYRPKSLSELNNVYDKAMRAEKAIKEGSDLLSVPEKEKTPKSENIFDQLESKAQEAERNQVFDPDITNIANDFLKRYAQPEKPKAAKREVKRPAPSIQSVYHAPAKPKQADVSLNMNNNSLASEIDAPAVPLHKPSPTMPAIPEPEIKPEIKVQPQAEVQSQAPAELTPSILTAAQTIVTAPPVTDLPSQEAPAPSKPQIAQNKPTVKAPSHRNVSPRVRITSTERNELMEEYMRVMSDEDDEPEYKKPLFSFFKKKKKYDEEEDTAESLYEELPEEEDNNEEVPVVAFDHSEVKYTDEYSDAPSEDEDSIPHEEMNIQDYIAADFDYSEEDTAEDNDEDASLDMSFVSAQTAEEIQPQEESEESEETEEAIEAEEIIEEVAEECPQEDVVEVAEEELQEEATAEEPAQEVVYAEEAEEAQEPSEEAPEGTAPYTDMIFEDIFSVSDESKRSHTGGNWEEVFGKDFKAPEEETTEEYPEYTEASEEEYAPAVEEEPGYEEYPEYREEADEAYPENMTEEEIKPSKGMLLIKIFASLLCVICILSAGSTLVISSLLDVNSGNLISKRYRAFSVSSELTELDISKGSLVLTENVYAHTDDIYVYRSEADGSFALGKVTSSFTNLSGDYFYVTKGNGSTLLVNRDNSMGIVIATYNGIGGILSAICEYYILITGALLIVAIGMIALIVLVSRKKAYDDTEAYVEAEEPQEEEAVIPEEDEEATDNYDEADDSDEASDEDEYYTDFDTDGIEQGLFSNI